MRRLFTSILCAVALASCGPDADDHDPIPEPSSSKELVIEQRSLTSDTTLTAVGLRRQESDKAETRWSYDCEYSKPISVGNAWKQRFRVTIRNISIEALAFEATVHQFGTEDDLPTKSRKLGRLMIPPLTEKRFSGFVLGPVKPADKLCEVELLEMEN